MRPAVRSPNAPARVAPEVPAVAFAPERAARVAAWSSRALLAAAVVFAAARTAPNAGPIALAGRLARETLRLGVPSGAESVGWLGACVMALVASLGSVAVACASAACAIGAFALVEFRSRAVRSAPQTDRLSLLAAPLAAFCALDGFAPGGGSAAWPAWALVLILLDRPSPVKLAGLAAATALWCNLGPEGLLAPLFALAVAAGATLDAANRWTSTKTGTGAGRGASVESQPAGAGASALRRSWLAVPIALAAACCTPAGFGFAPAALVAVGLGHAARGIVATSPAAIAPHAYPAGVAVLIAFALAAGLRARGLREALPVVCAGILALANGAFLPFFGIAAAPAIVAGLRKSSHERSLPAPFRGTRVRPAFLRPVFHVTALLAPALAAAAATAIVFSASATARDDVPIVLARQEAAAHSPRGILFCAKAAWCDVAFAAGERVVVDGRLAPYDAAALDEQRTIVALGPDWRQSLRRSGATAVLAARDSALATLLGLSPGWRVAARDGQHVLYERLAR